MFKTPSVGVLQKYPNFFYLLFLTSFPHFFAVKTTFLNFFLLVRILIKKFSELIPGVCNVHQEVPWHYSVHGGEDWGRGRRAVMPPYQSALSAGTPGFLICDFLTDRKSSSFGVWAARGGRETFQKGGGRSHPPFWKVSRPPGAAQTPKIDDLRSDKNHILKTRVWACLFQGTAIHVDLRHGDASRLGLKASRSGRQSNCRT